MAVRPNDFLLPNGFDTDAATRLRAGVSRIEALIPAACIDTRRFVEVSLDEAITLIKTIEPTLILDEEASFEWEAMIGLLRYYAAATDEKVLVLAETNRRLSKGGSGDKSGLSIVGGADLRALIREPTRNKPALVLLKQLGGPELDWKAGPFWWPVLASPPQAKPCVYATKVAT